MSVNTWLLLACFLLPMISAKKGKILIIPTQDTSHIRSMSHVGRELARRGHEVVIIVPHSQKQSPEIIGKMEQIHYGDPTEKVHHSKSKEQSDRFYKMYEDAVELRNMWFTVFQWPLDQCEIILSDRRLYETLKRKKFDLALIDGLPVTRCYYIVVHNLQIPYVSQTAIWPVDIGLFSQFIAFPFTTVPLFSPDGVLSQNDVGKLPILERVVNVISHALCKVLMTYSAHQQREVFKNYTYGGPLTKSLSQLASESKLWLFEHHPVLDFPRPKYDLFQFIGGLHAKPPKPLEKRLLEMVKSSKEGIAVVSFGADLQHMPASLGDKLAEAFKEVPELTFFWSSKGSLTKALPPNVLKLDWIPQNDLLGHERCKLFITHCGNNGLYEAVAQGVPMLGVPIHRDQPANALRMVNKGYGRSVTLRSITVYELVAAIREVVNNQAYRQAIEKASGVFNDAPISQTEKAAYWVEHALTHDTSYLKSEAMSMPWYQILGCDVVAVLTLVVIVVVVLICATLKCLFSVLKTVCARKRKVD